MTDTNIENIISPVSYATELDKPVLTLLDHLMCYRIAGEDVNTFLQGQFSNDINDVTDANAQLSSYSTPKGRMLATFFICKTTDGYLLITSSDIAEDVMKRLQMYIMRSKVTITKLDDIHLIGLSSDKNSIVLKHLGLDIPEKDYQACSNENVHCFKVPGMNPRFMLVGTQALVDSIMEMPTDEINVFNSSYWQWLDILAGIPMICADTQEAFVPQMANMELIDGVNFSKGCYPGQEVVARLHYLGNANRRMFRVESCSEQQLAPGETIYSSESKQEMGKFLTTVRVSDDKTEGLAVLRIEAAKDQSVHLTTEEGNEIKILELPYQIPTETKQKNK